MDVSKGPERPPNRPRPADRVGGRRREDPRVPRPIVATATSSDGGSAENSRVSPALSPVEQTRHEMGELSEPSVKSPT